MKDKVLRVLGWISTKVNWFVSLFCAREVFYLVLTMVVLFIIGMCCSKWSGALAFSYLFDAGKASASIWTRILFFATWMVGGGVLVSVMVSQYYKNVGGYFRRWPCLVRNHIVVLGWDDGMMMELKRTLYEKPVACYVITNQDVFALAKSFRSAGLNNVIIYKGDYDNETEWRKYLQVGRAIKVFIAGELKEEAHDARVRLLYNKLSDVVAKGKIKVNIHDFGLANQLMADEKEVFENFHQKWAEFLWSQLALPLGMNALELFIVGFGAMGKAVVLTMPDNLPATVSVFVTDDDEDKLNDEKARYDTQFGTSNPVIDKKWADALTLIENPVKNGTMRIIVVAKKRSEKGLLCMMDIIAKFGSSMPRNLKLALSQEIEGYDTDPNTARMVIGPAEVILFGMKKGC